MKNNGNIDKSNDLSFKASLDLFDYQSDFFFYTEKVNFMNINDIYSFVIKKKIKIILFLNFMIIKNN